MSKKPQKAVPADTTPKGPHIATQSLTPFGQQIVDALCDKVAPTCGMGFVNFDVGRERKVVRWLARKLGRAIKSVAGGVADLVEKGYLANEGECESSNPEEDGWVNTGLCILAHRTWQAYSRLDRQQLQRIWGMSYTDWLDWDGADGMEYPRQYDRPDWTTT